MAYFVKNLQATSDFVSNLYSGIDVNGITQRLHEVMHQQGYKIVGEQVGNITYEKGSRVWRILLGALIQYFKFTVTITSNAEGELMINIFKQTSGISGGLIGMNQVKNEMNRISMIMQMI